MKRSGLAQIIDFPKDPHGTSNRTSYSEDILDQIFNDPRLDQRIQERIEGQLLALAYRERLGALQGVQDSFDDIYLSELTPDSFNKGSIAKIQRMKRIRDLSDSIDFNDEWEG